jgi:hypothetical protein
LLRFFAPEDRSAAVEAIAGRLLMAKAADVQVALYVLLFAFRDAKAATAFVDAARRASRLEAARVEPDPPWDRQPHLIEAAVDDGVGRGGKVVGFRSRTVTRAPTGGRRVVQSRLCATGTVVGWLVESGSPGLPDSAYDDAVDRFVAAVEHPEESRARAVPAALPAPNPTLLVRVLDPDGKPVARARLRIATRSDESFAEAIDGIARVPRARSTRRLAAYRARAADGTPLSLGDSGGWTVAPDDEEIEVRLTPGAEIVGTVLGDLDAPLAGVKVTARIRTTGSEIEDDDPRAIATTADDGTFRLTSLSKGASYELVFESEGRPTRTRLAWTGGTAVRKRLRPSIECAVTVKDDAGAPIEWALVRASSRNERSPHVARTNANGEAKLRDLDPDEVYDLAIATDRGTPAHAPRELSRWEPASGWSVYLQRVYAVSGVVRDENAAPIAAHVSWKNAAGASGESSSGNDGRFEFAAVPWGKVTLVAERRRPSDSRRSGSVEATPEHSSVALELLAK